MKNQRIYADKTASIDPGVAVNLGSSQAARRITELKAETAPLIVHESLRSSGQSLTPNERAEMEARFGYNFSHVRIHTDARSVRSADAIDARAYTVGRDIVFADEMYGPQTSSGKKLLAHELAHVIQQNQASSANAVPSRLRVAEGPGSSPEIAADRAADQAIGGHAVTSGLGRQEVSAQRNGPGKEERRRLTLSAAQLQPTRQLRLNPDIEAQMRLLQLQNPALFAGNFDLTGRTDLETAMRCIRGLLTLDGIRLSLSLVDLDAILGPQPPAWHTLPPTPALEPLVAPSAGPDTPRAASAGDVLSAITRIPVFDRALTGLRTVAEERVSRDWERLSTGERVGIVSYAAVIGGGALTGILTNSEARTFLSQQLQGRSLPTGISGLTFQLNLAGPDQQILFQLDLGQLLPESLGIGSLGGSDERRRRDR
jgi:hypothetical protein